MLQAPEPSADPVPTPTGPPPNPLSANKSTILLASTVVFAPLKVGLVVLVMLSVDDAPVSSAAIRSGGTVGLIGATVSIVTPRPDEAADVLPALSVASAVI